MARVAIAIPEEIIDELPRCLTKGKRYVSSIRFNTGLGELLWFEIYRIEKEAKLTVSQKSVLELWLIGNSQTDIAELFKVSKPTISKHLTAAIKKTNAVADKGLLTEMIEKFGMKTIREYLADMEE